MTRETELVIEGYPRCANTRSVAFFRALNGSDIRLAHHVHSARQIIEGVRLGCPVVLLIREPSAAVLSLLVRYPFLDAVTAVRDYSRYYKRCLPSISRCVVVDFELAVRDFGSVIERVNQRFDTRFRAVPPPDIEQMVEREVDRMDQRDKMCAEVDIRTVARPLEGRGALKRERAGELKLVDELDLENARRVYDEVRRTSVEVAGAPA